MRKQLYTKQQTKHQYSNLLSTILKNENCTHDRCVLYIKTRKTDEKKKTQTDKDVKKTKCLLIQKKKQNRRLVS